MFQNPFALIADAYLLKEDNNKKFVFLFDAEG